MTCLMECSLASCSFSAVHLLWLADSLKKEAQCKLCRMRDLIKTSSWQICKYKLKESPVTLLSQGFWVSETETSNRFVLSFPKDHSVLLMPFDKAAILRWLVSTSETALKRHQQETIWKTDGPWRCLSKLPLIALQYYSKYVSLTYLMH